MSFLDAQKALENSFKTVWQTTTPIKYPNVPFLPPKDADNNPTEYVAVFTQSEVGMQHTQAPAFQWQGNVVVSVFVPENTGKFRAYQLAEMVNSLWIHSQFSYGNSGKVETQTPSLYPQGAQEGMYQLDVIVPYRRKV